MGEGIMPAGVALAFLHRCGSRRAFGMGHDCKRHVRSVTIGVAGNAK